MNVLEAHLQRQLEHSRNFFWHRVRWRAVQSELADGQFTLTDVGAGAGLVGDFLSAEFPSATYRFVEPLDSLAGELEARFGAAANANDADTYADSRYVTLLDVLEHIENDLGFLRDLAAKMAAGSTLIVTVPALQKLWSQWDVSLGHYRRYDKPMLRSLLANAPLRVREISYLFPEMLPPAFIRARTSATASTPDGGPAEFPDLSPRLNELLYRIGTGTLRFRRAWPAGTSLLIVAERV